MNFLALVLGRRRQGKSTLSLAVASARSKTVVVFDPNAQFLLGVPLDVGAVEGALEASFESRERSLLLFRPDPAQVLQDWTALAETLWSWNDYSLIIDEASVIQTPSWRDPWLDRFLRQAPDDVSLILTTHRAVDLNKLSRALASDLFLFRTTLEVDLTLLESEFPGLRVDMARTLGIHQVLHYWSERGGVEKNSIWYNADEWNVRIRAERSERAA